MKTFSSTTRKNIAASLIAPLAIIPAILVFMLIAFLFSDNHNAKWFEGLTFFIVLGLYIAYPITIFFGSSSVLVLKYFDQFTLVNTLIIAVILATLVSAVLVPVFKTWIFISYLSLSISCAYWYVFHRVANKI